MLEKLKVLGFVPESRAIKLRKVDGMCFGERYDKVTYLAEKLEVVFMGLPEVYVDAQEFLSLLPFIDKMIATDNYLLVTLKNRAEYKLSYLDVSFEPPLTEACMVTLLHGECNFTVLKKTALQNLIRPDMRCIYVDREGAVSCDFLRGTVDKNIKSQEPVLLPPDLMDYLPEGNLTIERCGDILRYTDGEKYWIWSPTADIVEEEEPWFMSIRQQAASVENYIFDDLSSLVEDSLKRLRSFGENVVFTPEKMIAGENFEPVYLNSANGESEFKIDTILSVIPYANAVLFNEGNMFLKKGDTIILVGSEQEQ